MSEAKHTPGLSTMDIDAFIEQCQTPTGVWASCVRMMSWLQQEGTIEQAQSLRNCANSLYVAVLEREIAALDGESAQAKP